MKLSWHNGRKTLTASQGSHHTSGPRKGGQVQRPPRTSPAALCGGLGNGPAAESAGPTFSLQELRPVQLRFAGTVFPGGTVPFKTPSLSTLALPSGPSEGTVNRPGVASQFLLIFVPCLDHLLGVWNSFCWLLDPYQTYCV